MDDWYNSWEDGNTTYGVGSVGGRMFEDSFTVYYTCGKTMSSLGLLSQLTQEEIDKILEEQWHLDIDWDIEETEEPDFDKEYDAFRGNKE